MATASIPARAPFDEKGWLPPGDHRFSWRAFRQRFAHTPWRAQLLDAAQALLRAAHFTGAVYVGGSFVTAKPEPGDIDIVLDCKRMTPRFVEMFFAAQDTLGKVRGVDAHLAHAALPWDMRELFRIKAMDDYAVVRGIGLVCVEAGRR